uniref:Uncharacterized protein n=1 Tax=Pundamilia nyererei TaxID=303518 RepID=A0A3B4HBX7_9CICH
MERLEATSQLQSRLSLTFSSFPRVTAKQCDEDLLASTALPCTRSYFKLNLEFIANCLCGI